MNTKQNNSGDTLSQRALAVCVKHDWPTDWRYRGVYLHLEVSELIESLRGKGASTPTEEAGDVLFNLMALAEAYGIPWSDVLAATENIVAELTKGEKGEPSADPG